MGYQNIFKRYELKFMLNTDQYFSLRKIMEEHMQADKYGECTICNLYFDTPDYLLIRRSIEKPVYKEKLRVRSYGVATEDSVVFTELKKKYESIVYKRRISATEKDTMKFLVDREVTSNAFEGQIPKEINYVLDHYAPLLPKAYISYDRQAFYGKDDHDFRMTFDRNILWRDYDLSLCKGVYGTSIIQDDQVLLEIKVANAIPLWLINFLSKEKIYKTSFSKYGTAYSKYIKDKII